MDVAATWRNIHCNLIDKKRFHRSLETASTQHVYSVPIDRRWQRVSTDTRFETVKAPSVPVTLSFTLRALTFVPVAFNRFIKTFEERGVCAKRVENPVKQNGISDGEP